MNHKGDKYQTQNGYGATVNKELTTLIQEASQEANSFKCEAGIELLLNVIVHFGGKRCNVMSLVH